MRQKGFVLFPIIVVITLICVLGYFIYKSIQLPKDNIIPVLQSAVPTVNLPKPSTTVDSGANWKIYTNTKSGTFTTSDWNDYSFSNETINYQLKYPNDWSLDGSVFNDKEGNKVAEFLPGAIILSSNQKCFDTSNSTDRMKIISKKDIVINEFKGFHMIAEVITEPPGPGLWYPNIYCLQTNNKAFVMAFYEYTKIPKNETLYSQILSTFKFTD